MRARRRRLTLERLESRHLLAGLVGHWSAADLDAGVEHQHGRRHAEGHEIGHRVEFRAEIRGRLEQAR